jgi:outer membrane protein OmpA-like peptidoglycan-associated protein
MRALRSTITLTLATALLASGVRAQVVDTVPARMGWLSAWELGLYPTVRELTADLAPPRNWGVGATAIVGYHLTDFLGLEGAVVGDYIPQLNGEHQSPLNEISPSLAVTLTPSMRWAFQPYLLGGAAYERFHLPAPLPTDAHNLSFFSGHFGVGARYRVGPAAAVRAEWNLQAGSHAPSSGFFTGVSFFPGSHGSTPTIVRSTRTVTERMTDTVVTQHTDTVHVNTVTHHTDSVRVAAPGEVVLVLTDATFDTGKSALHAAAQTALAALAVELVEGKANTIRLDIVGHTDNVGAPDYNYRLGLARASAVRDYLIAHGVAADRLVARSEGIDHPIDDNRTAAGRARNRRVVLSRAQ